MEELERSDAQVRPVNSGRGLELGQEEGEVSSNPVQGSLVPNGRTWQF